MKLSQHIHAQVQKRIKHLPAPTQGLAQKSANAIYPLIEDVLDNIGNPVAWEAPKHQPLKGLYKKNNRLKKIKKLVTFDDTFGPESIAIADDGRLFTGLVDGRIVQIDQAGKHLKKITNTGGRPLGMRMHPDGDLVVCDANLGLLKVVVSGEDAGTITKLTHSAEGIDFNFTDDLDITKDGRYIYFTDATSKWGFHDDFYDHIEHGGHGRVLKYDMQTKITSVLMRDLCFCNGVTLSPNEDYVLINETGSYCVHRYWLKDSLNEHGNHVKAGKSDIFIKNLPGFPDNIRFNGRDTYWVAVPVLRNKLLDAFSNRPAFRFAFMQSMRIAKPPVKPLAMILGFNLKGELTHNLQYHGCGSFHYITQALEHEGKLFISSLHEDAVGVYEL